MRVCAHRPAGPEAVIVQVDVSDDDTADPLVVRERRVHLGRRRLVVEVVDAEVGLTELPGADVIVEELTVQLDLSAGRHDGVRGLRDEHSGPI